MSFTANEGPTTIPAPLSAGVHLSDGLIGSTINIADLGADAQDGFTGYQGYGPTRPRWRHGMGIFLLVEAAGSTSRASTSRM